jgi:hypothetical protein
VLLSPEGPAAEQKHRTPLSLPQALERAFLPQSTLETTAHSVACPLATRSPAHRPPKQQVRAKTRTRVEEPRDRRSKASRIQRARSSGGQSGGPALPLRQLEAAIWRRWGCVRLRRRGRERLQPQKSKWRGTERCPKQGQKRAEAAAAMPRKTAASHALGHAALACASSKAVLLQGVPGGRPGRPRRAQRAVRVCSLTRARSCPPRACLHPPAPVHGQSLDMRR